MECMICKGLSRFLFSHGTITAEVVLTVWRFHVDSFMKRGGEVVDGRVTKDRYCLGVGLKPLQKFNRYTTRIEFDDSKVLIGKCKIERGQAFLYPLVPIPAQLNGDKRRHVAPPLDAGPPRRPSPHRGWTSKTRQTQDPVSPSSSLLCVSGFDRVRLCLCGCHDERSRSGWR
jgi:hypothetical protein